MGGVPTSAPNNLEQNQVPPSNRFSIFKLKFLIVFVLIILIIAGGTGAYLLFLKQRTTYYTLLPDDSQFYLGLSVKNHPQVAKMLELGKRFPGGEKMINYLDDSRAELFGQRKDPFKEILKLSEDEIFLAKISSDEPPENVQRTNPLEKLVNIVNFKGKQDAQAALADISGDENIITTHESYASAKIARFELVEQKRDEESETYRTGALPYMVTLPLSKNIFATSIDNFIVAAEKDSDVKKILDLVGKKKDKKLKRLADDEEHNEVVGHFPKETLLKFYQRQVLNPFSQAGLTSLPTAPFGGSRYDTTERETEGDNVFTVKRGFTIAANDRGFDLASYQLTDKSKVSEGLKHGFTLDGSLARRLPAKYNSNNVLFWAEVKDLKGILKDQEDKFWDIAQNSSDKRQKEIYAQTLDGINKAKDSFKKEFGLDVDEDILSWMTKQSAFFATSGGKDKAPEAMAVFEVDDSKSVLEKISKIKIKDYVKVEQIRNKSYRMQSDISSLGRALMLYSQANNNSFPKSLPQLNKEYIKNIPKQQNGQDYGYLTCANGNEAIVWGKDEFSGRLYAWVSLKKKSGFMDINTPPAVCNITVTYSYDYENRDTDYPLIKPIISDYSGQEIYSYPIVDYKGDVFAFRLATAGDLVIFSFGASDASIKEIIDSGGKSSNTLTSDSRWSDQFAQAPKIVGSVFFAVPENAFGIAEYFLAKEGRLSEYVSEDYVTIAKGYLKTIKSVGATTTQSGSTLITNTHIRIEAIDEAEAKQVEKALDRAFFDKLDRERESGSRNPVLGATTSFGGIFNLIRINAFSPNY